MSFQETFTDIANGLDFGQTLRLPLTGNALNPNVDDTRLDLGNGTLSWDLRLFGSAAANYISWDASANDLKFEDSVSLMFGTGATAGLGTAGDVEMRWDGTDFDILGAADDLILKIGNGTNSFDLWLYGNAAATYVSWDASADSLKLEDNVFLGFGTNTAGPGTLGDINITWNATKLLVAQTTTNSAIDFGVSGAGIDIQLYGDTVGADFLWDQSADSLLLGDGTTTVFGASAARTLNALVPTVQVQGTTVGVDGALAAVLYSATAAEGPELIFARSKSATLGTNTIVAANDSLGGIFWMGADGGTGFDPAASIIAEVAGTPGAATDMPGRLLFQTSPDSSQTPATRMTILSGATTVAQAQLGTAGTSTGALLFGGATSGVVTLSVAAVAGTWTMQLPAAVGGAGQQLTDAAGDGVCTWAAASLGAWKNDLGILDPREALEAVVSAPTHRFTYNKDVLPEGQSDGNGYEFAGIFAEEAPWAMYGERDGLRSGIAFSPVNAFGYVRAAVQALYEELVETKGRLARLETA